MNVSDIIMSRDTIISANHLSSNSAINFSQVSLENLDALANKSKSFKNGLEIVPTKLNDNDQWVLVTPTMVLKKRDVSAEEVAKEADLIDIPLEEDSSDESTLSKREILRPEQQPPVRVHIQNITEVRSKYKFVTGFLKDPCSIIIIVLYIRH